MDNIVRYIYNLHFTDLSHTAKCIEIYVRYTNIWDKRALSVNARFNSYEQRAIYELLEYLINKDDWQQKARIRLDKIAELQSLEKVV